MKTIAEQMNVKEFPFIMYNANGNEIYRELSNRFWIKREYDISGHQIYFEDSDGAWYKWEYDVDGTEIYFENSEGVIIDNRPQDIKKKELIIKRVGVWDSYFICPCGSLYNMWRSDGTVCEKCGLRVRESLEISGRYYCICPRRTLWESICGIWKDNPNEIIYEIHSSSIEDTKTFLSDSSKMYIQEYLDKYFLVSKDNKLF